MEDRILSYPEAINEAINYQMSVDDRVLVVGQGVDATKRLLGSTANLIENYGEKRVIDTPIAEDSMMGIVTGMSMKGLKPIYSHIRMDFILLTMNQIVNMATKMKYMYGGKISVPLTIRTMIGKSWGQGPQHSQGFYPFFMHIPGLKVYAPVTPYDANATYNFAIEENCPSLIIEHRHLYYQKGPVPKKTNFSEYRTLRKGKDITLLGVSQMAIECLRAAKILEINNIDAEVLTPVQLNPLSISKIMESVKKTDNLIIVDNTWINCGLGAEVVARLKEAGYNNIKINRMGFENTPCPTTPNLEDIFYPNAKKIARVAYLTLNKKNGKILKYPQLEIEEVEFKGPF